MKTQAGKKAAAVVKHLRIMERARRKKGGEKRARIKRQKGSLGYKTIPSRSDLAGSSKKSDKMYRAKLPAGTLPPGKGPPKPLMAPNGAKFKLPSSTVAIPR